MDYNFGISFSETAMHFALARENKIQSVERMVYPFSFSYSSMFEPQVFAELTNMISEKITNYQVEGATLSIALPMNFVHIKKIALPVLAEPELVKQQVEWELSNFLTEDINNYKVLNTKVEFSVYNYREIIFLAFKKEIVKHLSQMAETCSTSLKKVLPAQYLLTDLIRNGGEGGQTAMVTKLEKTQISSQLYIDGKYYYSYLDSTPLTDEANTQTIYRLCKNRHAETKNTVSQLPFSKNQELKCFVYGDGFNIELETLFEKNFSEPVNKLSSDQKGKSDSGLEAVQVLLD